MYKPLLAGISAAALLLALPLAAHAQQPAAPAAPDSIVLYFDSGSAAIRPDDAALLDKASRLYRDGKPIVMIVSGGTDLTGNPEANLHLSQLRADTVVHGLVSRGIPVERFQVLAKGESAPAIPADKGAAEPRDRRVDITWR